LNVTVLLFAAAREAAGRDRVALHLADGACVADALERLAASHPSLAPVLPACRAAVDEEFASRATPLRDGQTLAVLPPVSGG
jgi:molybdopterin converting factor subunit 1